MGTKSNGQYSWKIGDGRCKLNERYESKTNRGRSRKLVSKINNAVQFTNIGEGDNLLITLQLCRVDKNGCGWFM